MKRIYQWYLEWRGYLKTVKRENNEIVAEGWKKGRVEELPTHRNNKCDMQTV